MNIKLITGALVPAFVVPVSLALSRNHFQSAPTLNLDLQTPLADVPRTSLPTIALPELRPAAELPGPTKPVEVHVPSRLPHDKVPQTDLELLSLAANRMAAGHDSAAVVNDMFDEASTYDAATRIPGVEATPELNAEGLAKLRQLLQDRKRAASEKR